MKQLSKVRFDGLASYARHPLAPLFGEELAWFATTDEQIVAALIVDTDGEFSVVVLARDARWRYRWIDQTGFHESAESALSELREKIASILPHLDELRIQGDESGTPVDFFCQKADASKLNRGFVTLRDHKGFAPARAIITAMMRWYEDVDGNFIEQFQSGGFDPRIWELYLFAVLSEAGYAFDRTHAVPDFVARGMRGDLCLEATSVNPSISAVSPPCPERTNAEKLREYAEEYLPIRYAGPLTAKLAKRYWEASHVAEKPLILAIQDFHQPMSMTWSRSALPLYLYGYEHYVEHDAHGTTVKARKKTVHRSGSKEVESGFFFLPDAEHVSAVFFNSSGTLSKFNRMGRSAGFGPDGIVLIRKGLAVDINPAAVEPVPFMHITAVPDSETWIEGADVYHNPNALHPIDPEQLPGAAHHRLRPDGQLETLVPNWQPLTSTTSILVLDD